MVQSHPAEDGGQDVATRFDGNEQGARPLLKCIMLLRVKEWN